MGAFVKVLQVACEGKLDEVANTILGEMKGIVGAHHRSGAAEGAIHIESTGQMSRFIGGTGGEGTMHLYYLNEGNGNKTIVPKRKKALKFSDGSLHKSARPYKGIHFVEEIASRHGG